MTLSIGGNGCILIHIVLNKFSLTTSIKSDNIPDQTSLNRNQGNQAFTNYL